jgi:hypothetical protein
MFDVRRYLSMEPWTGLITMISDRTYLNLEPYNCKLVTLESLGGLDTRVVIETNRSTSSAQQLPALPKQLEYLFTRLDPNSFFRTVSEDLLVDQLRLPTNTQAILDRIQALYGVVFDIDDFEPVEVTNYGAVTLQSKPASLRWVGPLTLTVVNSLQQALTTALTMKSSPTVFRPLGMAGRIADFVYAAAHDFTAYRYDLLALLNSPNGVGVERLCQVLKEVTGQVWVCQDDPAPYNICSAVRLGRPEYEILYSGRPIKPYTLRTDKRNLIVLRLDQTRCTALAGSLLLHYD